MKLAAELIGKKRDGLTLSEPELQSLIAGIADDSVSDAQIAAFCMAVYLRGMNIDEQTAMTLAMRDSGEVLNWPGCDGPVLDKHSTGGVGDMTSLMLSPMLAACGCYVPMISGRGLGHTGGTLDKLEGIPGFDTAPDLDRFRRWVTEQRIAIIGQTAELAPADRRIYVVRDVTATVESRPLIVASILSKKLAGGLDGLVLDIKVGSGAFMTDAASAKDLAQHLVSVSARSGMKCRALLTDMDQPLARTAGNNLELIEAIDYLAQGIRHSRLHQVVLALGAEALMLAGMADSEPAAVAALQRVLDDGRAAECFGKMVAAQGGPADFVDAYRRYLAPATISRPLFSPESGYVQSMNTRAIGLSVVELGGGRLRETDAIDHGVGLSRIRGIGEWVDSEIPLAVIHAASKADWQAAAKRYLGAVEIGQQQLAGSPAVLEVFDRR